MIIDESLPSKERNSTVINTSTSFDGKMHNKARPLTSDPNLLKHIKFKDESQELKWGDAQRYGCGNAS